MSEISCISFQFPGLENVGCAFQCRGPAPDFADLRNADVDPLSGGNISYSVRDEPARTARSRRALAGLLRAGGATDWAELHQVHGDALHVDPPATALSLAPDLTDAALPQGDGLATDRPGLALCIKTADCQPILLAHTSGRYVAALHAGWRGNRCAFPTSGARRFCQQYGLDPREVLAVRGPSLGPDKAQFTNFSQEWGPNYAPWFDAPGRTLDLWSLTRRQLEDAGLLPRHIFGLDLCTMSNPQFFSYRRQRGCGRQASLIWIKI